MASSCAYLNVDTQCQQHTGYYMRGPTWHIATNIYIRMSWTYQFISLINSSISIKYSIWRSSRNLLYCADKQNKVKMCWEEWYGEYCSNISTLFFGMSKKLLLVHYNYNCMKYSPGHTSDMRCIEDKELTGLNPRFEALLASSYLNFPLWKARQYLTFPPQQRHKWHDSELCLGGE